MFTTSDHRQSVRHPFQAKAEVRLGNGVIVEGDAQNISLRGLMFHSERRLPLGKFVRVILIPESPTSSCRINAGGFVARLHDDGVAVRFTDIDPDGERYLCDEVLHQAG